MQFEVSSELIDEIKLLVENHDNTRIQAMLQDLFPADIAETLDRLDFEEAQYIYELLDEETSSAVLIELKEELREELLASFSSKEIAEEIDNLDSDDAADVINELPDLQARLQVALFNILQEGDVQIRGFNIRIPLDLQFVFTVGLT